MKIIHNATRWVAAWVALICASTLVCAQTAPESTPKNGIDDIVVSQQGGSTIVKVTMRKSLAAVPASFTIANPARIVFDFPATDNNLNRTSQQVQEGQLRSVNIVQVADRTRLILNMRNNVPHEVRLEDKTMFVTFQPQIAAGPATKDAAAVTHFAEPKAADASHAVRDINFKRGKNGEGLIVVDLSDANVGIDIRQQGQALMVDLLKVSLPDHLRRRMDVTDFATPVTNVNTTPQGENVRIAITPRGLWEHNAYQSDNQFVIEVKPLVEDPNKLVQGSRGGYQGEKLSLTIQDLSVRQTLDIIADFTGFNLVVSDAVTGNLTLRLKDVPWDQALDIILNTRGLDMRKNGNVIWIAPRDELAAKEKLALESKQQIGDLEPLRTETFQLNYHKAKTVLEFLRGKDAKDTRDTGMLSKRGVVVMDERSNKLFITDTPTRLEDIRRVIVEIDVAVRQVMIEARIVEATDTFSKELGVRLGGQDPRGLSQMGHRIAGNEKFRFGLGASANDIYTHAPDAFFPSSALGVAGTGYAGNQYQTGSYQTSSTSITRVVGAETLADTQFVNLPTSSTAAGKIALALFNRDKTQMINLELSALEADNRGKTITSPRILTADKVEALIEQGVQVPYLQATSSGATSVSFQKAVMALKVVPNITPDGRVMMTLDINKDAPDYSNAVAGSVPINTKHVKTDVLVDNGGTVVIGGIFEQTESHQTTRVPMLGDLPYVGFLFRNNIKSDSKRELLVFITPKIVAESLTLR